MNQARTVDPLLRAVLLYLCVPRKKPPTETTTLQALSQLAGKDHPVEGLSRATSRAIADGVDRGEILRTGARLALSEAGKARCGEIFDLTFPVRKGWNTLKRLLIAQALFPSASPGPLSTKLGGSAELASAVLNQHEQLLDRPLPTPTQIADAIAWRELGGDPSIKPSWPAARQLLLARRLGVKAPSKESTLLQNLAARVLQAPIATRTALEAGVLARWLREVSANDNADHGKVTQAALDGALANGAGTGADAPTAASEQARQEGQDFVARVHDAAVAPETARFGDKKAFIASVFDTYSRRTGHADWAAFQHGLLEAHRAGQLRLARADLIPAMDRTLVDRSELSYQNATFHFVELP